VAVALNVTAPDPVLFVVIASPIFVYDRGSQSLISARILSYCLS
jgi:hypothetical protein